MDREAIDDAVTELHQELARSDLKRLVPLAVPHLIRLAPRDTATRMLLRKALANGWLDEFVARMYLVQAGDTPGTHVAALLKAVGSADRPFRSLGSKVVRPFHSAVRAAAPRPTLPQLVLGLSPGSAPCVRCGALLHSPRWQRPPACCSA
jgi:hypothetical protein